MLYRNSGGFSLIELLVVLVIIGLLLALIGPDVVKNIGPAKQKAAKAQIELFSVALDNYKIHTGEYPTTEQGLEALIKQPPGVKNWKGPYLKKKVIPKDPWGNDYIYKCPGEHNKDSYDLYSYGKDGQKGGEGENKDITNWE